jgi:hypothetical protein
VPAKHRVNEREQAVDDIKLVTKLECTFSQPSKWMIGLNIVVMEPESAISQPNVGLKSNPSTGSGSHPLARAVESNIIECGCVAGFDPHCISSFSMSMLGNLTKALLRYKCTIQHPHCVEDVLSRVT